MGTEVNVYANKGLLIEMVVKNNLMLSSFAMCMNKLKPMMIILLMLTSALAGCAGDDTSDLEQQIADLQQSNDEMNETINQQNQDNADLQSQLEERNSEIATLNSNVAMLQSSIADAETYRDSLLVLLENSNTSNSELLANIAEFELSLSNLEESRNLLLDTLNESIEFTEETLALIDTMNDTIIALNDDLDQLTASLNLVQSVHDLTYGVYISGQVWFSYQNDVTNAIRDAQYYGLTNLTILLDICFDLYYNGMYDCSDLWENTVIDSSLQTGPTPDSKEMVFLLHHFMEDFIKSPPNQGWTTVYLENYASGFVSNAVTHGEWNGYGNLRDDPTKCWTVRYIGGGNTDCESVYFSEGMSYESSTTVATYAKEGFFVSNTAYNDRILYLCQSDVNFHINLGLSSDMIVYVKDLGAQNEVVTTDSSGTIVGDYGADITYVVNFNSNLEILDWNDPDGAC